MEHMSHTKIIERFRSLLTNKLQDAHVQELLKGSSTALFFRIIGAFITYLFMLLITHTLGAHALGIFALSSTLLSIVSVIARLGVDGSLLRFIAEHSFSQRWDLANTAYAKTMKFIVPYSIALSAAYFLLSTSIAQYFFKKEYLSSYFQITAFALVPMTIFSVNAQALRAVKKIAAFSFIQNVSNYLAASLILAAMLAFGKNDSLPIIAYSLAMLISAIVSSLLWEKSRVKTPSDNKDVSLSTIIKVALPMLFSTSMLVMMGWTDTIILGIFRTEEEIGVYNASYKIALLSSIVLYSVHSIAAPKFSEFFINNDYQGLQDITRQSTKLMFWLSFPIFIIITIFPAVLLGFFGDKFQEGVYPLLILTAGQLVNVLSGSVGLLLTLTGKQNTYQNILVLATLLSIALNWLLVPLYGILGAAVANSASLVLANILSVIAVRRYYRFNAFYVPFLKLKQFSMSPECCNTMERRRSMDARTIALSDDIKMPLVILGGAPRCGTTSVFNWLGAHPDVCPSKVKETYYFIDDGYPLVRPAANYVYQGMQGYYSFFQHCAGSHAKIMLEATPDYLYQKTPLEVLPRLKPKILFIFRKPSARAYSFIKFAQNNISILDKNISFSKIIHMVKNNPNAVEHTLVRDVIKHSMYVNYVTEWIKAFGENNIYIAQFEKLERAPNSFMKDISRWLDIDVVFWDSFIFTKHNPSYTVAVQWIHVQRQKLLQYLPKFIRKSFLRDLYYSLNIKKDQSISPEDCSTLAELDDEFEPYNRALAELTHIDLSLWSKKTI